MFYNPRSPQKKERKKTLPKAAQVVIKMKQSEYQSCTLYNYYYTTTTTTTTTDPRVDWFLHKLRSNFVFWISTKPQLQNLNQTSTSRLNLNFKILTKPSLTFNFITSTCYQQQNTDQTSASKSCLNFNFKILTKPCAQSLNKIFALWPNSSFQICTKLSSTRFSASTSATITT